MSSKPKIKLRKWEHTCSDGCCYTWGTDVYVNGKKVSGGDCDNIEEIITDVLKHFGIEAEINLEIED